MNHPALPFCYINLDRDTARRAFIESCAMRAGISASLMRIRAIDAQRTEFEQNAHYVGGGWRPRWSLTPTEVACFESHRQIWQRIVSQNIPMAVIMEDDIILSSRIGPAVASIAQSGQPFDIVRLDGCHGKHRYGAIEKTGNIALRPILQTVPSAACYLLGRAGAQKLLAASQAYSDHLDDFIFTPAKHWQPMQLWPAVAVQGMFCKARPADQLPTEVSKSIRTQSSTDKKPLDKGPLAYRVYKELRRLRRKVSRKLGGDGKLLRQHGHIGFPPQAPDLPPYRAL